MPTPNEQLHQRGVARVAALLRHRGHRIAIQSLRGTRTQLLVDGAIHVAVRVARRTRKVHNRMVGGKAYSYYYSGRQWNFYNRGKRPKRLPDLWVLVTPGDRNMFVVPPAVLGRVQAYSLIDTRSRDRRARLWPYLNRWDLAEKTPPSS